MHSMRRWTTLTFWLCLAIAGAGLSCRLLWMAGQTETGLETLSLQWRDATYGLVAGGRIPIHSQEPTRQAEFWLREVDRVLEVHAGNADVTMGAALVLDHPGREYQGRYLESIEAIPGFGVFPRLDQEGIERAEKAFEAQCGQRSVELAEQATTLKPSNVAWWRLRALLLWSSQWSLADSPRAANWLEILDQCAQHDADNALYDYLAASFYWRSSAELTYSGEDQQLVVKDQAGFDRGARRFARGQEKPFFEMGDAGFTAVAEFLRHTQTPLTDHEKIVNSRELYTRRSLLLRDVWRWQGSRADEAAAAGDVIASLDMHRQNLHLIDQFTGAGPSTAYSDIAMAIRLGALSQLSTLANEHKDEVLAEELAEIDVLERDARLGIKVIHQTGWILAASKAQPPTNLSFSIFLMAVGALVAGLSPALVVILLLLGLAAVAPARLATSRDLPEAGILTQGLSLATAFVATVVVFGLAPARLIPEVVQAWVLTILVLLTPLALASLIGWSWLRRRAFQFSLRAMLISVFVLCLLFGLISIARQSEAPFTEIPFDLSIPPRGWGGLDAASLKNAMGFQVSWATWAVLQWTAYHGHYLTLALEAVFAAMLLHFRMRGVNVKPDGPSFTFRDHVAAQSRSLAKASLTLSALVLLIYLALAPSVVAHVEQQFQQQMAFARQPSDHWSDVEKAVQQVKSNPELMDGLRESVNTEMMEAQAVAGQ